MENHSFLGLPLRVWVYALLVVVGLIGAIGDACIYQWAKGAGSKWWLLSCFIWVAAATIFGAVLWLNHYSFGTAVVLALVIHSVVAVLIDWWVYGKEINVFLCLGLLTAALTFVLLEMGNARSGDVASASTATSDSNQ